MFPQSFSEELARQLWLVPICGLFVLTEMVLAAKPFDRRAWYFNWSYWPIETVSVASLFMLAGVVQAWLLPLADAHGLAVHLDMAHPELALLAWLFFYDFLYYWTHRLQHTRPLWPVHALHHGDPSLNATTTFREHWLEDVMRLATIYAPLGFVTLDHPPAGMLLADVGLLYAIAYYPIFLHSNVRVGLGPLNWLLATPQLHRIHHSVEPRHRDRNFALFFPLLDVAFGTYWHPKRGEYPETGVDEFAGKPLGLVSFNLYPFRVWAGALQGWRQARRIGAA